MLTKELMTAPVVACRQCDTLNAAAQLMWEHDCGVVAVVDDEGRLVGMITDRDICMAAFTQGSSLYALPVDRAMAKEVFSCRADDSIDTVERLMGDKQIRRVPVVDGDHRPIGIVSLNDVAQHVSARRKKELDRAFTSTVAAVCRPRKHPSRAGEVRPKQSGPAIAQPS